MLLRARDPMAVDTMSRGQAINARARLAARMVEQREAYARQRCTRGAYELSELAYQLARAREHYLRLDLCALQ